MVVKKVMPTASVVNSQPNKVAPVFVEEKELPVHPALAQVPEDVNVQNDFERVVYNHAQIAVDATLAELEKVAVNSHIIKEIDKPSVALRCKFCHARAQFRLYVTNLFNNILVCEQDARKQLFPESSALIPIPIPEIGPAVVGDVVSTEVEEEVINGDSTDSASTDGAVSTGSEAGTVEVPEGKSDNGQASEAVSDTP